MGIGDMVKYEKLFRVAFYITMLAALASNFNAASGSVGPVIDGLVHIVPIVFYVLGVYIYGYKKGRDDWK